jgi:hypothetical protein
MTLDGPSGGVARGAFVIENTLDEAIVAALQWTEFSADRGPSHRPAFVFTPAELQLGPREQAVVEVVVPLDETLDAGSVYRGEIFVAELPGTRLRVDLRRRPDASPAGASEANEVAAGGVEADVEDQA